MNRRKTPKAVPSCARQKNLPRQWQTIWWNGQDRSRDGIVSWRNYVALALQSVSIFDVANGLGRAILEMEQTTARSILEDPAYERGEPITFIFDDWLPKWREHFTHWHDPVRSMLGDLCIDPEARLFADQLHAVDGELLLDFLLGPCCITLNLRWALGEALPLEPGTALILELDRQRGRMIDRLRRTLYQRFAETALFIFLDAPEDVSFDLNFDRLCPMEEYQLASISEPGERP